MSLTITIPPIPIPFTIPHLVQALEDAQTTRYLAGEQPLCALEVTPANNRIARSRWIGRSLVRPHFDVQRRS